MSALRLSTMGFFGCVMDGRIYQIFILRGDLFTGPQHSTAKLEKLFKNGFCSFWTMSQLSREQDESQFGLIKPFLGCLAMYRNIATKSTLSLGLALGLSCVTAS